MSIHETWMASIDDLLTEPGELEVYSKLCRRMSAGEFAPHVDIVTQRWSGSYDLYDAYAFGQVYASLLDGDVTLTPINLDAEPAADAKDGLNNERLAGLPAPFAAHFVGGGGDDDGVLSWDEERAPLEVGYTRPLTTLLHLHHGSLARWPYGHTRIWLLIRRRRASLARLLRRLKS